MPSTNSDSAHPPHGPDLHAAERSSLAAMLEPVLRNACQGRLSEVRWFRSAWQAGGASTGFATFSVDGAEPAPVVVKLPVGPSEYRWTTALGGMPHLAERILDGPMSDDESHLIEVSPGFACATGPTPRVYAAGTELNGYDLAWIVVERLSGDPLNKNLSRGMFEDLLTTAVEWYIAAERVKPIASASTIPKKDWAKLLTQAKETLPDCGINELNRWKEVVKHTAKLLPRLLDIWHTRPINTWCHGDIHPGNAMRRTLPNTSSDQPLTPSRRCVLIDLALVHPGHWVEDAAYLERLFWGRSDLLDGLKPVSFMAQALRQHGQETSEDYALLAHVRRTLMAACVPCFLTHEGHPKYVGAALEVLERTLPTLAKA